MSYISMTFAITSVMGFLYYKRLYTRRIYLMSMIPKNIKLGLAYTYNLYVSQVHGYVYDLNCLFSHITYMSTIWISSFPISLTFPLDYHSWSIDIYIVKKVRKSVIVMQRIFCVYVCARISRQRVREGELENRVMCIAYFTWKTSYKELV